MTSVCIEFVRPGLDPRHAAAFIKAAGHFKSDIAAVREGYRVDGKSILGLLSLEPMAGMQIVIEADGEDEEQAIAALARILEG